MFLSLSPEQKLHKKGNNEFVTFDPFVISHSSPRIFYKTELFRSIEKLVV